MKRRLLIFSIGNLRCLVAAEGIAIALICLIWCGSFYKAWKIFWPMGDDPRSVNEDLVEGEFGELRFRHFCMPRTYLPSGYGERGWAIVWTTPSTRGWYGMHGNPQYIGGGAMGFGFLSADYDPNHKYGPGDPYWVIAVPFWFIFLAAMAILVATLQVLRDRERERLLLEAGKCKVCGYDIRYSGSLCPECGTQTGR